MAGGALVAGGTGALGEAVVRELLDAGWAVTATWVVERERERIEAELGDSVSLARADLLDAGEAAAAVAGVEGLRAVVNLVGGFAAGPRIGEAEPGGDAFERMLTLNVMPAYRLACAAMPVLAAAGGGAFVCVSSRTAYEPFSGGAGYSVGKAAVTALVRALDVEYRDDGVRVNAVVPSVIDTPANRESMPKADFSKWVEPAAIARVIRFLVSDDAEPTSGAAIPVYGRA
jgi:NAD(P)-dependent dehydrogenase (short-subunit alcohol dehydrogenase family)